MTKLFSILILFIFSSNLIAELFYSPYENAVAHASSIFSSKSNGEDLAFEIGSSHQQDGSAENDKDCADPCHRGQCHFGHCAFHVSSGYATLKTDLLYLAHFDLGFIALKSPYLEGPKRPPRLS